METAAKHWVWVVVCGCVLPQSSCFCAITACVNEDRLIVVNAVPAVDTLGFEIKSETGFLIPMADPIADPYALVLSNTAAQVTWGALGAPVRLEGDWVTRVGYDGAADPAKDLSLSFEADSQPAATVTGFCRNTLRGDFNFDRAVDLLDIDLLARKIAGGTDNQLFDLNVDALVDQNDLDLFLSGNLISSGNKLNGDADFDGTVGFADFLVLSAHFGQLDKNWSEGDFVPNGQIEFADFLVLAHNFGATSPVGRAHSVPEPQACYLAWVGLFLLSARRDRRLS